jgi:hypothetical protein
VRRTHVILIFVGAIAAILAIDPALAVAGTTTAVSSNPGNAGSQIEAILQELAGPLLIGLMAIRGLGHYMSHDYSKAIGHFGLGALVAVPIYAGGELTTALTGVAHTLASNL